MGVQFRSFVLNQQHFKDQVIKNKHASGFHSRKTFYLNVFV